MHTRAPVPDPWGLIRSGAAETRGKFSGRKKKEKWVFYFTVVSGRIRNNRRARRLCHLRAIRVLNRSFPNRLGKPQIAFRGYLICLFFAFRRIV